MDHSHILFYFLLGFIHSSLTLPGSIMPREDDIQIIYDNLTTTLQYFNSIPKGLQGDKQIDLVRVTGAYYQIVAGVKYYYTFEAKGLATNNLYNCYLVVVIQEWLKKKEVDSYQCKPTSSVKSRRAVIGEEKIIDIQNKNLQQLKPFLGQALTKYQGSKYLMSVVQLLRATEKVVAGYFIEVTMEVGETNCLSNEDLKINKCVLQEKNHQICDVQVWIKPWINFKKLVKADCELQISNSRKVCAGCPVEADPNDETIRRYLKTAIHKLNAEPSAHILALQHINKATTQIVSGVKYTIDFEAKDESSGKFLSCRAIIISQWWISQEPIVNEFKCNPRSNN